MVGSRGKFVMFGLPDGWKTQFESICYKKDVSRGCEGAMSPQYCKICKKSKSAMLQESWPKYFS